MIMTFYDLMTMFLSHDYFMIPFSISVQCCYSSFTQPSVIRLIRKI